MLQPGKHWFGRHRSSRPLRAARRQWDPGAPGSHWRRIGRLAHRLLEDRRLEGNKNERLTVRKELVDRVRQEITAGTYDTLMKMEAAFERLLVQMAYE